jgi:DHA1 family bicyclomycin/chloramphenicol resistance-like MFS transporter
MNRGLLIFILAALSMLGALSIDAYLPALPSIAQNFSVSAPAAQQSLTVYLFAFAFMTLFYGTLSDSFGRRPVILIAMMLYFLSSVGVGLAGNLGWLLFFRFLQGLTAGAGSVVGRAIIGDLFSGAEAQRVMSYVSVIFGLAPAIAPVLGGWLQATLGWRSIFGFIALFSLALFLLCLRELPESLPRKKRHAFHMRVIFSNYWEVGSHARFILQSLSIAFSFSGIMLYVGAAPAFIMNILHLSVTDFGWLFIPIIAGMMTGSILAGKWSHRYSPTAVIRFGFIIMAISAIANVLYTFFFTATIPWAILPTMTYSFGMALGSPAMTVTALEIFPKTRGLAASLQSFTFMSVFAIGSGLICPLLFGSALRLAIGVGVGFGLSAISWWLSTLGVREKTLPPEVPTPSAAEEIFS